MSHQRFNLVRHEDISGVSGVGPVAEGIEFSDGVVALRWLVPAGNPGSGNPTSVVFHDNGMDSVERIHGHSGATEIVWVDGPQSMIEELERTPEGRQQMRAARAANQRARDNDIRLEVLRDVENRLRSASAAAFLDGDTGLAANYAWSSSLETVRREIRRVEHENNE